MNFEKDIGIDENALDEEWLRQPHLYLKSAQKAEELQGKVKKAKEQLELTDAEIEKEIREGAEKNTEKSIATKIILNKEHQKAAANLFELEHEYRIISKVALSAIEQKKTALENLVKLYVAGYFSKPTEPKKGNIKENAINNADEKQVKKLNRRTKHER